MVVYSFNFSCFSRRTAQIFNRFIDFPNEVVVMAYLHPEVDESEERFTWGEPNESALRNFAREKFGWSAEKIDELLVPTLAKWKNKQSQMRIDSYFSVQFGKLFKLFS